MKVLDYLNDLTKQGASCYTAVGMLEKDLGIKCSQNEEYKDLFCLNYDQINSPKFDPIVMECRSLVLGVYANTTKHGDYWEEFYVVSRSFDRFFNYGEGGREEDLDITQLVAWDKIDGSLVNMFYYGGQWLYRTRKMIMPSSDMTINGTPMTWKNLIEPFTELMEAESANLDECVTYIFEVVSPYNRVVTRYDEPAAYLLAARENKTGEYVTNDVRFPLGINVPKPYYFKTIKSCIDTVKYLPNLEEGYVMYTQEGYPVVKVKSPAYVAAHRLRGEGLLTGKRIMDLIFINEVDEYLSIFPEDCEAIKPYQDAYNTLRDRFETSWSIYLNIEDQKEFALCVKDLPYSGMLFSRKRNTDLTFLELFNSLNDNSKYRLVEGYVV